MKLAKSGGNAFRFPCPRAVKVLTIRLLSNERFPVGRHSSVLIRRTKLIYNDGTFDQTGYDSLGRVISKTDQAGKVTQYGYDALGYMDTMGFDWAF